MIYKGSCHCQAISFEVEAPEAVGVIECNCSICQKSGFVHLIVPLEKFKLLKGEDNLSSYRFNTKVANHTFCKTCGIKPFYTPRSHPDGVSVNLNTLDTPIKKIKKENFDGQNWEQNASTLEHLSK